MAKSILTIHTHRGPKLSPSKLTLSSSISTPPKTMARTEEAEAFFHAVYTAVQEIPAGKVTTYGHIAKLVGTHPTSRFNNANVPWQRVINAKGTISPRYHLLPAFPCLFLRHRPHTPSPPPPPPPPPPKTLPHLYFLFAVLNWIVTYKYLTSNASSQPSGARNQAEALQAEDVEVSRTAMGEFQVDFSSYGWFPEVLPSEED
ncbi:6-O-methylguanine DNA methyltransferase [Colletotrichum orchidophilum]|uniref:6-O-methylguanine DNA methyltransferase n=1 Tax=Colletotrichum orchidophilum TaxID=1209926 RepID=A0A1G4AW61_9PEZI|nr:6-O-methylguanine DNA methyltransferase [Colletotrichum orchidophilum]OHE93398.1 6-O-methylguanine DNA methyltransferase [Colletotrichum orchidophilum]